MRTQRLLLTLLISMLMFNTACSNSNKSMATTGPRPKPLQKIPTESEIETAITKGVDFLVHYQLKNGSWGSATNTKALNIFAPIPGAHHAFKTGSTSLALTGLIESNDQRPEVIESIEKGEAWMIKNLPRLRRADMTAIYNIWGHAYSIHALNAMYHRKPNDKPRQAKIIELIEQQVDMIARYEFTGGGWGYYDFDHHLQQPGGSPTSFTTATVMIGLKKAQKLGVKIPEKMIFRGIRAIHHQRKRDFTYVYALGHKMRPMYSINRPGGSLGRSQACNAALRIWDEEMVTDEILANWLERLFARNGWLSIGRKRPVPHESWFAVAGYFYYYGHYYGAVCIQLLPPEQQPRYQAYMARTLINLQQNDGSWWDYPLYDYHRPYGTGYALMTLNRCRPPKEQPVTASAK